MLNFRFNLSRCSSDESNGCYYYCLSDYTKHDKLYFTPDDGCETLFDSMNETTVIDAGDFNGRALKLELFLLGILFYLFFSLLLSIVTLFFYRAYYVRVLLIEEDVLY